MSAVTVHLFASYAESFGVTNLKIDLAPQSTVADLVAELRALPGSYVLPPTPRVAVNRKFATPDQLVHASDEVALIPPVAGG
ncbi:MAG TPA: MoaD/ThiS family protein [Gemmatimonadaceae bacterium]